MNQVEVVELAGRGPTDMSVAGLVVCAVLLPLGVSVGSNIAQAADRVHALLAVVLPGPVERESSRSLRFAGWVIAFLSFVGMVVEIRSGVT
ncbi:hypothetical protein [Streptomyces antibioticus]|uniref:Uncharacterized protein n=1 Tax=Streptomyces antibioticus TaxID=1890 RepID=A0AAE6YA08_STRAT|nr:hypothetical protein [Streptomyces antibioticus]QIT45821.1 hypothetical protein HCX60_21735 [Streptomyces antibioticus]